MKFKQREFMNLTGIIYFLALALIISAIFSFGFKRRGPWGNYWFFFIVIFLAIWMADIRVRPAGSESGVFFWSPPLATGILLALILAAASPPPKGKMREEKGKNEPRLSGENGYIAVGLFFWSFLFILVAGVFIGLFTNV